MIAASGILGEGDVLTPILNSVTPGVAVLVVFVIAMTVMVQKVNGLATSFKALSEKVGTLVTREDLRVMRSELKEELDERYDARFLRRPDRNIGASAATA